MKLVTLTILLMLTVLVAGCQTTTGKSAGRNVDDATITTAVKAKLVGDKAANLTRVDVDTNNATVYLNVWSTRRNRGYGPRNWRAR